MAETTRLAELEHLVLLVTLRLEPDAYAPEIAHDLETSAGRKVSRGSLYQALDRLERRGLLVWTVEAVDSGSPRAVKRRFTVTEAGREALASSRATFLRLWDGFEPRLVTGKNS